MNSGGRLLLAAVPIFLSMVTGLVASLIVSATLGRHATLTLAAWAVMGAVLSPVMAAVSGALRGLMPFVAPHRDDPVRAVPIVRDARWLTFAVGTFGAVAVLVVPWLAAPPELAAELGLMPWLIAAGVLCSSAGGGANAVLISLDRSRQVLWSSLAAMGTEAGLAVLLVPLWALDGMGVAWLASSVVGVAVANLCLRRALGRPIGQARPRVREIVRLAKVSLPMAGTILIKFGGLGIVTLAVTLTTTQDIAAHAILGTLTGFTFLASLALAQAALPEMARATTPGRRGGSTGSPPCWPWPPRPWAGCCCSGSAGRRSGCSPSIPGCATGC